MVQLERQQQILEILEKRQTASVRELAKAVYASEASVRRDIETLEKKGFVLHIYGGVMLSKFQNNIIPVDRRDAEHSAKKDLIAQKAARLIRDGDTVLMDASSTVRRIIRYMGHLQNVRIVTNNQRLFDEADAYDFRLYCTGGTYNRRNHCFTGTAAEAYLRTVYADIAFFSSQGLSEEGEISDVSEEETSFRRVMLSRARRRVFLCDSSKIGVRQMFTLCSVEDVTDILSDAELPFGAKKETT